MKPCLYKTIALAIAAVLTLGAPAYARDWSMPITVGAGGSAARITLGIANGVTAWHDAGRDQPRLFRGASIDAYFPRPGWGVVVAGQVIAAYQREGRGKPRQEHHFEVISAPGTVELRWDISKVPPGIRMGLYDSATGAVTDMRSVWSTQFYGGSQPHGFTVIEDDGDQPVPAAPRWITTAISARDIALGWSGDPVADLGGYKLYVGTRSGSYDRSIDLKDAQSYTFKRGDASEVYYLALTAYNQDGDESERSQEVVFGRPLPALTVTKTGPGEVTAATGSLSWSGATGRSEYPANAPVTLSAAASGGSHFVRWKGCESAKGASCRVVMSGDKTVTATFSACSSKTRLDSSNKLINRARQEIKVDVTDTGGCGWTAASHADWIKVSPASGGEGGVTLTVDQNNADDPRMGTVSIGSRTFTVVQTDTERL